MKDYKYEKVEGMTVGQVVDSAISGVKFAEGKLDSGCYVHLAFETINVKFIQRLLDTDRLLIAVEQPWWEKHVGGLVMVRDRDNQEWNPRVFLGYCGGFFSTIGGCFIKMRPLTKAEKDAIITEG